MSWSAKMVLMRENKKHKKPDRIPVCKGCKHFCDTVKKCVNKHATTRQKYLSWKGLDVGCFVPQ